MDRPIFSSHGGSGAEFWPIGLKMGGKTGILGLDKWRCESILVAGCRRSGYRPFGLLERKTFVSESKNLRIRVIN